MRQPSKNYNNEASKLNQNTNLPCVYCHVGDFLYFCHIKPLYKTDFIYATSSNYGMDKFNTYRT